VLPSKFGASTSVLPSKFGSSTPSKFGASTSIFPLDIAESTSVLPSGIEESSPTWVLPLDDDMGGESFLFKETSQIQKTDYPHPEWELFLQEEAAISRWLSAGGVSTVDLRVTTE